jgi:DNA-binding transcriptional ArsR family regulator
MAAIMPHMPIDIGKPACRAVSPSAPSELGWLLDLLSSTARYAEPALAELDAGLLPGISRLRRPTRERIHQLWSDGLGGCPELMYVAHAADSVLDENPARLLAWLDKTGARHATPRAMLTEPEQDRPAIEDRLRRLGDDGRARHAYRSVLSEIWQAASTNWERHGRAVVASACDAWKAKLDTGTAIEELVPPRHPLTQADRLGFGDLFGQRHEFAVSPLYFCMSGGHVIDLDEYVHVAVPASDLLPVRKVRDAAFVADRLRLLAEPTRVHILIQLLSAPGGVMELARALHISQPTVSGHLKVLREAGLIQPRRFGTRTVMVASRKRIERLLEDARATIVRWD